jgi:hypothetical protein
VRSFAEDPDDAVRAAVVDALARRKSRPWPTKDPGEMQGIALADSLVDDTELARAREQFGAIEFSKEQRFDLFVYRYLLDYPPRPKLERAFGKLTAGKDGAPWLRKLQAKGGGAIFEGLLAAIRDPEVDTICLLSDGVPSYGTVSRDYRVLQEVRRANRWRRVATHTILLGSKGTDKKFMRSLARQNGGIAVGADGQPLG